MTAFCAPVDASDLRKLRFLVLDIKRLGSPSPRVDALLRGAESVVDARTAVLAGNGAGHG